MHFFKKFLEQQYKGQFRKSKKEEKLTLNMMASIFTSKYGGSVCSTESSLTDRCKFKAKALSQSNVRGSTLSRIGLKYANSLGGGTKGISTE